MRRGAFLWLMALGLILILLLPGPRALATPTPPYLLVNHETRECGERWIGDDCRWCDPLPGWEVVGLASSNQCPEGYTWLDRVEMDCRGYETQFCCSGGSHRGDCPNLVLNSASRQCAFVEDVESCILPEGWQRRPEGQTGSVWTCPHDHGWLQEPLQCVTGDATGVFEPTETPTAGLPGESPESAGAWLAPGLSLLVGLAVVALVLVGILAWLLARSVNR